MTTRDDSTTRTYRMRKRQQEMEETRRRIVEAAVELHGSVGPAHTTVSAIAEVAGVQRSTVYRHFEDEEAIFAACTSHWMARHPWPRTHDWHTIDDPAARLLTALVDLYRYYEENRQMLSNSYRDIAVTPAFVGEMMKAVVVETHETLVEGWSDRAHVVAVGHAIDFRAWQTLDDQGLDPVEAAGLMASMVAGLDRT
ncbi:MAG: TetR/AcrR family transcriptional regulator [Acidimicrobiia bacterium]